MKFIGVTMQVVATVLFLSVFLIVSCEESQDPTLVTVNEGQLRGIEEEAVDGKPFYSFRGIPFAKPPVHELRFEPPVAASHWSGIRDATKPGPACAQVALHTIIRGEDMEITGSEDCLYLNVFSPMTKSGDLNNLPVMVFIHGGGFQHGSALEYPPYRLMTQDIVLVVIQFRVTSFGFLSTGDDVAPGNMGMLDQTAALAWIQKNIVNFKGDPTRVTIFGESAGSAAVHYLILSPAATGLFHRGIMQSGSGLSPWALAENHREVAYEMARTLKCGSQSKIPEPENCAQHKEDEQKYEGCIVDQMSSKEIFQCLKEAPMEMLIALPFTFCKMGSLPIVMTPRVDGNFLPDSIALLMKSNRINEVDIMSGVTRDEGALFTPIFYKDPSFTATYKANFDHLAPLGFDFKLGDLNPAELSREVYEFYVGNANLEDSPEAVVDMFGDRMMWYPADTTAHFAAQNKNRNLYVYEFAYKSPVLGVSFSGDEMGKRNVNHAEDLMYLFGGVSELYEWSLPLQNEDDATVSRKLVEWWANFARSGNPTPDGPIRWAPYTTENPGVFKIDWESKMQKTDPKSKERKFWRQLPLETNMILFPDLVKQGAKYENSQPDKVARQEL